MKTIMIEEITQKILPTEDVQGLRTVTISEVQDDMRQTKHRKRQEFDQISNRVWNAIIWLSKIIYTYSNMWKHALFIQFSLTY